MFCVGAVHDSVAEPVATACTVTLNAGSDAVRVPSLTVMTMPAVVPTSPAPGVPDSAPVLVLNAAHAGLFVMLKVSVLPSGSLAVGVNAYAFPGMTVIPGVPLIVGTRFCCALTVSVNAGIDTISNFEAVRGSAFADTLTGSGNNVLEGGAGADQLFGNSGGSVTATYEHATAGVIANLNNIPGSNTGDAAGDTYTNIANLRGSHFNDILIGDNNNNVLDGNGTNNNGGDVLTGNGGADTFVFGGGKVTVTDFNHGQDLIDLSNQNFGAGFASFSALLPLITAAGHGNAIDFGNEQVLTLTNVDVSTLVQNDFILHH